MRRIQWSQKARTDLVRLYDFLAVENRQAAAHIVRRLRNAPSSLRDHPRLGPLVREFLPREVRRLLVADYEIPYEVRAQDILIVDIWHMREDR